MKTALRSLEETEAFARLVGEVAEANDIIILVGELGAGKTTFTKGLALGLGIGQTVKSPTYTIIREYLQGRIPLYHMDIYRTTEAVGELGLEEYFEGEGLCVVEWGNLLEEQIPDDYLVVTLEKNYQQVDKRELSVEAHGQKSEQFLMRIAKEWGKDGGKNIYD